MITIRMGMSILSLCLCLCLSSLHLSERMFTCTCMCVNVCKSVEECMHMMCVYMYMILSNYFVQPSLLSESSSFRSFIEL